MDSLFSCPLEEARAVLLGIPYDGNPNETAGSRYAPDRIRKDLAQVFSSGELEGLKVHDAGNVGIIHGEEPIARTTIINKIDHLRKSNPNAILVVMGGEHSITFPVVEALRPMNYLCFDVHWDLRDSNGIMEHESLNKRIIDLGVNVEVRGALVGSPEEKSLGGSLPPVDDPVYVSVDLDVLSDVPVSTGFSGKMSLNELWKQIEERELLACDVTGYNPLLGRSPLPAQLIKRILLEWGTQ